MDQWIDGGMGETSERCLSLSPCPKWKSTALGEAEKGVNINSTANRRSWDSLVQEEQKVNDWVVLRWMTLQETQWLGVLGWLTSFNARRFVLTKNPAECGRRKSKEGTGQKWWQVGNLPKSTRTMRRDEGHQIQELRITKG